MTSSRINEKGKTTFLSTEEQQPSHSQPTNKQQHLLEPPRKIKLSSIVKSKVKQVSKKNQFIDTFIQESFNDHDEKIGDTNDDNIYYEDENMDEEGGFENEMYDIFKKPVVSSTVKNYRRRDAPSSIAFNNNGKGFVKDYTSILDNDFFSEFIKNITNIHTLYKILPDKRQQIEVLVCRLMGQIPDGYEIYNSKESSIGFDDFINANKQFPSECLIVVKVSLMTTVKSKRKRVVITEPSSKKVSDVNIYIHLDCPGKTCKTVEGKTQLWREMYTILMLYGFVNFISKHKITQVKQLYPRFVLKLGDVPTLKKYFKPSNNFQHCQWFENMCYYIYALKNVYDCCISF